MKNVTLATALEFALKTEEIGAQLYKDLAEKFASDRELRELFQGLGEEEQQHQRQFQALKEKSLARLGDKQLSQDQQEFIQALSLADVFLGPKGAARDTDKIKTRDDALERAMNLERSTLGYYQALREVTGPDETLDALIAIEKRHFIKVMQLMVTGAKFRGFADNY